MSLLKSVIMGIGLTCTLVSNVHASVTIGGTRVVYPLEQREVTVRLENDSTTPSLVQVWMDDGDANAEPGAIRVPFVISPPIFRMEPRKSQVLRLMYSGGTLPQDRESVFWLNVLDIPPKPAADANANTLQLAYRSRIKVFARPSALAGDPQSAPAQLAWKLVTSADGKGQSLSVVNPTPYHVTISEIEVRHGAQSFKGQTGGMVAPKGTAILTVEKMSGVFGGAQVSYRAVSDYGGPITGTAAVGP